MTAYDRRTGEYRFPLYVELLMPVGVTVPLGILLYGLLILGRRYDLWGNLMLVFLAPTCIMSWRAFVQLARRRKADRDTTHD